MNQRKQEKTEATNTEDDDVTGQAPVLPRQGVYK
jgi:hypothetical protein